MLVSNGLSVGWLPGPTAMATSEPAAALAPQLTTHGDVVFATLEARLAPNAAADVAGNHVAANVLSVTALKVPFGASLPMPVVSYSGAAGSFCSRSFSKQAFSATTTSSGDDSQLFGWAIMPCFPNCIR